MTDKNASPELAGEEKFRNLHSLLAKAGLSVDDVVPLFEVSRVSIYTWMRTKGPGQPLIRSRALKVITLIESVVASGDLPLKDSGDKDRRPLLLNAVFKKHLTAPPKVAARAED